MDEILKRIKRAVQAGHYDFTDKARTEQFRDCLTARDIEESIFQATAIAKTIRSTSTSASNRGDRLHVIISPNFDGTFIYTKGKLVRHHDVDVFYVLISAKMAD